VVFQPIVISSKHLFGLQSNGFLAQPDLGMRTWPADGMIDVVVSQCRSRPRETNVRQSIKHDKCEKELLYTDISSVT